MCGLEEREGFVGVGRKEVMFRCGVVFGSCISGKEFFFWVEYFFIVC